MKVILFIIALCFSVTLSAQSNFLKKLPKPIKPSHGFTSTGAKSIVAAASDLTSTFWAVRPIAIVATAYLGGTVKAMAGGGASIQNITYTYPVGNEAGSNYCNYAFSLITAIGGSVIEGKETTLPSYGVLASVLNNTIGAGYVLSMVGDEGEPKKMKGGFMVVWTYNFNN